MISFLILISSSVGAYAGHNWGESFFRKRSRNPKLIVRGYHVHHSVWGLALIVCAFVFASGVFFYIFLGYGLGNLWQHKTTHNKVNEPGMVFVTKYKT